LIMMVMIVIMMILVILIIIMIIMINTCHEKCATGSQKVARSRKNVPRIINSNNNIVIIIIMS